MNPALDALAAHQAAYRFFDTEVVIRSDSSEILARFDLIYRRFRVRAPVPRGPMCQTPFGLPFTSRMACHVLAGDRPFGGPALVLNGQTHLINDPDTLFDYAHTSILNAALAQIRTHFLIHGAALSADGAGIILAGHSGCGKTTLALELVRRGFRFLSDDIAAIACADHRLYPFPKSLGIWPGTRQLIPSINLRGEPVACTEPGRSEPSGHRPEAGRLPQGTVGRQLVDIEALYPHQLGEPCPPRYLVVLTSSRGETEQVGEGLYVTVDRVNEPLLAELSAIPGISNVAAIVPRLRVTGGQRLPVIRLSSPKRAFVEPAIEDICARHQTLIFDVAKGGERPPGFDAQPHLESLPKAEAALELLRRLRGGARSALLRHEFQGSATRLYLALSEVVAKMACYRLFVGQLREMADLVYQVVEGD